MDRARLQQQRVQGQVGGRRIARTILQSLQIRADLHTAIAQAGIRKPYDFEMWRERSTKYGGKGRTGWEGKAPARGEKAERLGIRADLNKWIAQGDTRARRRRRGSMNGEELRGEMTVKGYRGLVPLTRWQRTRRDDRMGVWRGYYSGRSGIEAATQLVEGVVDALTGGEVVVLEGDAGGSIWKRAAAGVGRVRAGAAEASMGEVGEVGGRWMGWARWGQGSGCGV
ncbi:hypothetical protein C8F04DRAFT_1174792 [Mycena alexandri]|uniref:Uncharacterized protein n=1 Tax=Mycena alexandri TaxID=1745969 RepID=A0AAD6XDI4_9AGAR|nr:hypothetical protein C8F04DRAFT_1174792 [Mycena alexandri]